MEAHTNLPIYQCEGSAKLKLEKEAAEKERSRIESNQKPEGFGVRKFAIPFMNHIGFCIRCNNFFDDNGRISKEGYRELVSHEAAFAKQCRICGSFTENRFKKEK